MSTITTNKKIKIFQDLIDYIILKSIIDYLLIKFSIVKINESIINDYFKFNLFLDKLSIDDFKNFKNKFENNQLVYKRIVVNIDTKKEGYKREDGDHLLAIIKDILLNEKSDIFKIFELNYRYLNISSYSGFNYSSIRRKIERKNEKKGNDMKSTSEFQFNNLSIFGFNSEMIYDKNTLKILKFYKCKSLIYDGSDVSCDSPTHVNLTPMFNPDMVGQQIESIKIKNKCDVAQIAEPGNLMKIGQFQNLHSIKFPIELNNILFGVSEGKRVRLYIRNIQENMKSELKKMINSLISSKSLKNVKISSLSNGETQGIDDILEESDDSEEEDPDINIKEINESKENISNYFKPLFSELNTSIERIEFDCYGLFSINTFSNLLKNKSIKYLYLNDSDFIVYKYKSDDDCNNNLKSYYETISINQYLFDNIFSSPLTSIRHYKINLNSAQQLKFIFNLIINNIFKLQLYSLIFKFNKNKFFTDFVKEFNNLIIYLSTQKQQQQQKQQSNNINLKEIKIKIKHYENCIDDKYIQELSINPYFLIVIKNLPKSDNGKIKTF
ncbi:hypothetical protein ACTFIW_011136 [Dictyostelium discoideum]